MAKKTSKRNGGAFNQSILEIIREEGDNHLDLLKENDKEKENLQKKLEQFQFVKNQEKLIYAQKHQEEKEKIKEILEEIKALKKGIQNVDQEIDKATEQIPVVAGTYHLNFFEKIKEILILLRKNIEEANSWLELLGSTPKNWNSVVNVRRKIYYHFCWLILLKFFLFSKIFKMGG